MTDFFENAGRALLANGYLVIPIEPGHKRPAMAQWQSARIGAGDLARYKNCGVGVLTGQGANPIAAIDVDTTCEPLASEFAAWCEQHLGLAPSRVGLAPKFLLAFRAETEGWTKATGAWFSDAGGARHRLEVLGRGQQFVAYAIHPTTNAPYEWTDLLGGLEAIPASDLPLLTEEKVHEALAAFEDMAIKHGLDRVGRVNAREVAERAAEQDPLDAPTKTGVPLEEIEALLAHIGNEDYDTWVRVGMALHHEYDGSIDALEAWDRWSMGAQNYAGRHDLEARWETFGRRNTGSPITVRWILKLGHQAERDTLRAAQREALDTAKASIASCADSIDLLGDVAKVCGEAAGGDLAARTELIQLLRARWKELTGVTLNVADARTAINGGKKLRRLGGRRERTEFGNAERMLDHYGDGLMYVPELDHWFTWTGVYWRRAAHVELEHMAKETVRALPTELDDLENDDERKSFLEFAALSQKAHMVDSIVRLAKSDPRVVVPVADVDRQHHLLGVGNGAVNLRTGRLKPPDPADRITISTPTEFDPDARCPLWEETLREVFFDDQELVDFFQRLVGYVLLGRPDEDLLIIPYGNGANGKSTVLGAIREVLGAHARMASADTFLAAQGATNAGGAREDVLRLRGARFVYVTEPDEGSELKEGLVKSMTGGEPMPARGLYAKHTIEVVPTWTTFMPTNHRPVIKGDDNAIWRRLLPLPFTRNFETDLLVAKDPDRGARLSEEGPGILAWCVVGASRYLERGLQPPATVRGAREAYRSDMDLLAEWLAECCEEGPAYEASTADLWASWEAFARARGELPFLRSSRALGRRLANRFKSAKSTGGKRIFRGLRVREGSL